MSTFTADRIWQRIHLVERLCKTLIRPMTVKQLVSSNRLDTNAAIEIAESVRKELTVRLASRLHDFHRLPYNIVTNPFVKSTYDIHFATLDKLLKIASIRSTTEKTTFMDTLLKEREAHDKTVDLMGQAVRQIRFVSPDISLDKFLERFFFFRIGRRLLIDHMLSQDNINEELGWSRCIQPNCCPATILKECIANSRNSCKGSYSIAPLVILNGDLDFDFPFVPNHLALIVTEILKNAMRATVEYHTLGGSSTNQRENSVILDESDVPPIHVTVCKGKNEIVIKVSDKGGGMSPQKKKDILTFGYSTVGESQDRLSNQNLDGWVRSDMAGYGFGLPLARTFARYFGGNITLQPCFGVGTDVYVTLRYILNFDEPICQEFPSSSVAAEWTANMPTNYNYSAQADV